MAVSPVTQGREAAAYHLLGHLCDDVGPERGVVLGDGAPANSRAEPLRRHQDRGVHSVPPAQHTHVKKTCPGAASRGAVQCSVTDTLSRGSACVAAEHSGSTLTAPGVSLKEPSQPPLATSRAWMKKPLRLAPEMVTATARQRSAACRPRDLRDPVRDPPPPAPVDAGTGPRHCVTHSQHQFMRSPGPERYTLPLLVWWVRDGMWGGACREPTK